MVPSSTIASSLGLGRTLSSFDRTQPVLWRTTWLIPQGRPKAALGIKRPGDRPTLDPTGACPERQYAILHQKECSLTLAPAGRQRLSPSRLNGIGQTPKHMVGMTYAVDHRQPILGRVVLD